MKLKAYQESKDLFEKLMQRVLLCNNENFETLKFYVKNQSNLDKIF